MKAHFAGIEKELSNANEFLRGNREELPM